MATTKNPKEVIFVNCHEIPETICVETRFITPAAVKQKKNEEVFYITNKSGSFDLTRNKDQVASAKNLKPASKPKAVTVNIQAIPTVNPMVHVQQCQPPQQVRTTGKIVPLATALTNLYNKSSNSNSAVLSNLPVEKQSRSAGIIPLANMSQLKTFNLNTSMLSAPPLGNTNTLLNIASVKRNFTDQIQQTDVSAFNMKSFAIQCKLDEELEDVDVAWPAVMEEPFKNPEIEMERFLKFIKDNSKQYKNCKECLICGEVCKSNKYFYGHMAIHQGPKVLCFKCGIIFDHKYLLHQHKCQTAQQLKKAFLQCPHHSCSVVAISKLELYDHINEHDNNRMYKCSACRKSFCTGQEFIRHLLVRAKCYSSTTKMRYRLHGLESQNDRLCRVRVFTLHTFKKRITLVKSFLSQRVDKRTVCKICLRSFPKSAYNRHRVLCIAKFRKRLIRKKLVNNIPIQE